MNYNFILKNLIWFNIKTYGETAQWLNPSAVALSPLRDSPEAINLQMLYKLFILYVFFRSLWKSWPEQIASTGLGSVAILRYQIYFPYPWCYSYHLHPMCGGIFKLWWFRLVACTWTVAFQKCYTSIVKIKFKFILSSHPIYVFCCLGLTKSGQHSSIICLNW